MKNSITILAVLAGTTGIAQQVFELPEITLTANLSETSLSTSGSSVAILTYDDINSTKNANITRVLQQTPSVSVVGNGGFGQTSNVSIRGSNQNYIGVYYDGIDVTDPSYVQSFYDFGATFGGSLGRIEILRGSQGALYGSNAVGGVVNLQSNRPTEDGFHGAIDVFGGSEDTFGGSASALYKNGKTEFALNFEHLQTDGISAALEQGYDTAIEADDNIENDSSETSRLSAYGSVAITDNLTVGANFFFHTAETEFDDTDAFNYLPTDGTTDDLSNVDQFGYRAFAEFAYGDFTHELFLSGTKSERTYFGTTDRFDFDANAIINKAFDNAFDSTRQTVGYRASYAYSDANHLTVGAEYNTTDYEASGFTTFGPNVGEGETTLASIYTEFDFAPAENVDVTFDYRHDDHSEFGGFDNYRFATAIKPVRGVTLRGSYGTGYRAPSLYELFDAQYGNAALTPEESTSWDIGAEYAFDNGLIRLTYFETEIENFINYVSDPVTFLGGYENVDGTSKRSGYEIEGKYDFNNLVAVNFAYANIDATDPNGNKTIRVPESQLSIGANYRSDFRLNFGIELTHVSGLEDAYYDAATFETKTVSLEDYILLDARVGYAIGNGEIYLAGNNLTDADYQTVTGFGTPGRSFTAGYKFNF